MLTDELPRKVAFKMYEIGLPGEIQVIQWVVSERIACIIPCE